MKANRIHVPNDTGHVIALRKCGVGEHALDVFQRASGEIVTELAEPDNVPSSSWYKPSYDHRKLPRFTTFVNDNCENLVNQPNKK